MADSMHLEIVSPTQPPLKSGVKQVYIPAYRGEAGILHDHKPYITLLKPGELFYTDVMNKDFYLYIQEGLLEVNDNKIVIICDSYQKAETFKKEEIEEKLAGLKSKIQTLTSKDRTPKELEDAPEELQKALAEQNEFLVKQEIIAKIAKKK
jgi:F-type H+-transporting ATPase subunit epsilon